VGVKAESESGVDALACLGGGALASHHLESPCWDKTGKAAFAGGFPFGPALGSSLLLVYDVVLVLVVADGRLEAVGSVGGTSELLANSSDAVRSGLFVLRWWQMTDSSIRESPSPGDLSPLCGEAGDGTCRCLGGLGCFSIRQDGGVVAASNLTDGTGVVRHLHHGNVHALPDSVACSVSEAWSSTVVPSICWPGS